MSYNSTGPIYTLCVLKKCAFVPIVHKFSNHILVSILRNLRAAILYFI